MFGVIKVTLEKQYMAVSQLLIIAVISIEKVDHILLENFKNIGNRNAN